VGVEKPGDDQRRYESEDKDLLLRYIESQHNTVRYASGMIVSTKKSTGDRRIR